MSGETEANISGWTVDTLHSHLLRLLERDRESINERLTRERERLEERWATQTRAIDAAFAAADKAVTAAMAASEKAVEKAEAAATRRFESMNEFRASLSDLSALMMTRTETIALIAGIEAQLRLRADGNNQLQDRLMARISEVEGRLDTAHGSRVGAESAALARSRAVTQMIGVGGLALALLVFVVSLWVTYGR